MTFFMKARNRETRHEQRAKELLEEQDDCPSPFFFIGKGFALNVLNPFVWIFWFSAVAIVVGGTNNTLITILFFLIVLNRIAGILLVCCGLYFTVFKGIVNLV